MTQKIFNPWVISFMYFLLLIWKLVQAHCFPDPRVTALAQQQYWGRIPIRANRGIIQDSRKNVLAISSPVSSFFIDPEQWFPENAVHLKGLVPESTLQKISGPMEGRYVRILRAAKSETAQKILALNLEGLFEEKEKKREYPHGQLLSHVLGFCDVDENGQAGIELAWDSTLFKPQGYKVMIRHSGNSPLTVKKQETADLGTPLSSITLTVDAGLQYIVEKNLNESAVTSGAKWASAICVDPNTGAVLSMASWPAFNPNNRSEFTSKNITNNAVGRAYEPGSTFKPILMGIAIENKLVRTNEIFNCPLRIKVADGFITEAERRAMGKLSTAELLVKSSNVGMAQIGIRANSLEMYRSLQDWGFDKVSDIELNGTEKGLLASPGQWRGVVPANIAIGQGLAVTPLQLTMATAAIVNGGKLLSPYIVQEAVDSTGEVVYQGSPNVIRSLLTPETCQWLRGAMREVVLSGTGRRADTPAAKIAAKSGTAQVAEKGKYVKGLYVSSFIGFWPYENPQYLLLVVIGEPSKGKYYGGEVAGPAFKNIVEEMSELEIFKTDKGEVI